MKIDDEKWDKAQRAELAFWEKGLALIDERAANKSHIMASHASALIWGRLGYFPTSLDGKTIIDIGCGPTARCSCFSGATLIGIDPLIEGYWDLPGGRLRSYDCCVAKPAEENISAYNNSADMVVCMNCLDHCQDAEAVIGNMLAYLKPDGVCVLSVDVLDSGAEDPLHPLRIPWREVEMVITGAGGGITWYERGESYPYDKDGEIAWQDGWAGGKTVAHHWKFRKAA